MTQNVPTLDAGTFASPLVDPVSWMSITISGMTIGPKDGSGYIKLRRAGRPYKWQVKDASGQDGATPTYRGKKPPDFEIEFHLWTDQHFAAWQALSTASLIYDASKTTVDPTDVYHPALAMVGISQMIVDECGAPEQQGDRLYWIATVKAKEFFLPIATNVTDSPSGAANSDPTAPGTTPDPAYDALQKQIAAATTVAINDGVLSPQGSGLP